MIKELKTFILIVKQGSFARAAIHLGVTTSAVSSQIKNLEENLNIKLFNRSAHSVTLTDSGKNIVDESKKIIAMYDNLRGSSNLELNFGKVKLGVINTIQIGLLPTAFSLFQKYNKNGEIKVIPGVSTLLLSSLIDKELDLTITVKPNFLLPKEIYSYPLYQEPFVLIYSSQFHYQNYIECLLNNKLIGYDQNSLDGRKVFQFLLRKGINVDITFELDEIDAIVKMVELGLGVSIIPKAGLWLKNQKNIKYFSLEDENLFREIIVSQHHVNKDLKIHKLLEQCFRQSI
ncbi:LysR family transcriptional regulator [Acinetobacter sp.]|uniref:LysR family transcriptional regulator n=1 Tax=Acinetobacter sp. TaxID=472 RepID=UPI0031E32983